MRLKYKRQEVRSLEAAVFCGAVASMSRRPRLNTENHHLTDDKHSDFYDSNTASSYL